MLLAHARTCRSRRCVNELASFGCPSPRGCSTLLDDCPRPLGQCWPWRRCPGVVRPDRPSTSTRPATRLTDSSSIFGGPINFFLGDPITEEFTQPELEPALPDDRDRKRTRRAKTRSSSSSSRSGAIAYLPDNPRGEQVEMVPSARPPPPTLTRVQASVSVSR